MGGKSQSTLENENGALKFYGEINTDGGGFTSCSTIEEQLGIADGKRGIEVTAETDGQLYKMMLRTADMFDFSQPTWQCDFAPESLAPGVHTFVLPFSAFQANKRGVNIGGSMFGRIPVLDLQKVRAIGVNLSYLDSHGNKNGQDSKKKSVRLCGHV